MGEIDARKNAKKHVRILKRPDANIRFQAEFAKLLAAAESLRELIF